MMTGLFTTENLISLLTLSAMEVVLGIDNVIFVAILSGRVPKAQQNRVRRLGLVLALFLRLGLLFTLSWLMGLERPLFTLFDHGFSGRDLVLVGGGLFLMFKSTQEIYERLEGGHDEAAHGGGGTASFGGTLVQIALLDIVFSLDSVITAVGMVPQIWIMVVAMVVSSIGMLLFSGKVAEFISRHPSLKVLALSFLLTIGVLLVAEGFGKHVDKGYIYFAMGFSFFIELLNMRMRKKQAPVALHQRFDAPAEAKTPTTTHDT